MTRRHLNLLVDTNVWLDLFLGRPGADFASKLLSKAYKREDVIATAPTILKDVFYLACLKLKELAREDEEGLEEGEGRTIISIAWSCLRAMQERSVVVGQGFGQHLEAMLLEEECSDYEDDLLVATAKTCSIDYIITNDKRLLMGNLFPTMTPAEYVG